MLKKSPIEQRHSCYSKRRSYLYKTAKEETPEVVADFEMYAEQRRVNDGYDPHAGRGAVNGT